MLGLEGKSLEKESMTNTSKAGDKNGRRKYLEKITRFFWIC